MRKLNISISVITVLVVLFFSGCSKVLDQPNLNAFSPQQIWNNPNLANAYIVNLYQIFGNYNATADAIDDQLAGIYFQPDAVSTTNGGGPLSGWDYGTIRRINEGIASLEGSSTMPQDQKDFLLGQLYFLRAYSYFPMVTNYGGVPYLKKAQVIGEDSLEVPRNSTKACFDFIIQDLDSAISLLPQHIFPSSSDYGKIDGNFALAFKAKVFLYEASPQFHPSNPWDNSYWESAYTENLLAYQTLKNQGYQLFPNYGEIAKESGNSEIVFCVINRSPDKTAGWDRSLRPGSLSRNEALTGPTWKMVKSFPMLDGKAYDDPTGKYYKTDHAFLQSFWLDRDPRFSESIVWNGKLYPVAGTVLGYRQYTVLGIANPLDAFGINPNAGIPPSPLNRRYAGFFVQKNCDLTLTQSEVGNYDFDYIVMRFAEVMLNYAEAANETGHLAEAMDILKQIRQRAGIEPDNDGNYGITATTREEMRHAIMKERNIEFCFEGLRFNDLRRWRMFNVLDGVAKQGVEAIAINPDGTEMPISEARQFASTYQLTASDFKYSLLTVPTSGVQLNSVPEKYYFAPIQQSVIAADPKLEQNVGWGGTFDPTIH